MTDTIKFLRKELKRDRIEEGTVVVFDRVITQAWHPAQQRPMTLPETERKVITYATIFVDGHWYFTGKGQLGNQRMTTREFLDRMSEPDIIEIAVVTQLETIRLPE